MLKSVRYDRLARPLEHETVRAVIADAESRLHGAGRLVIRASGTEPVIRVMAEGEDASAIGVMVEEICAAISGAVGESQSEPERAQK